MKVHTIRQKTVLGTLIVLLCLAVASTSWARIPLTADCALCHDMHDGQPPNFLKSEYEGNQGCVNCHSSASSSTTYVMNPCGNPEATVPVVNYTGSSLADDAPILASGNFFWVQTEDSKGHNIFPDNPEDDLVDGAPFQAGTAMGCSWDSSCHRNFDLANDMAMPGLVGRQGCLKCHMLEDFSGPNWGGDGSWHSHHHDDSNPVVGSELNDGDPDGGDGTWDPEDGDGYFRFLRGHQSGDGHGVAGVEDADWQDSYGPTHHNEYLGFSGAKNSAGEPLSLGPHLNRLLLRLSRDQTYII